MARIKAEVKEHAHQQRLARQQLHAPLAHPSLSVTPAPAPATVTVKTEIVTLQKPCPVPAVTIESHETKCIDLTGDDETEDEENADEPFDEPFDATMERIREEETKQHEEEEKTQLDEMEIDQTTGTADDGATDESEVDEAMPLATSREAEQSHDEIHAASTTGALEDDVMNPSISSSSTATETVAVTPAILHNTEKSFNDALEIEIDGHDEEEQDEHWPELRSREEDNDEGSDMDLTASDDGGDTSPTAPPNTTGDSLEDGEIFEEGAVAKSPTAVKIAIALELQARAVATAKKKQKKRGRKKNKRKAEVMLAGAPTEGDEVDEFGRSVRHHLMPHPMPDGHPSHLQIPIVAHPGSGIMHPVQGPPHMPIQPMLGPPRHPPHMPHPPPHPPHIFHGPRQFADDQIVRVNRHGGFEPFALHANRGPRPPIAPAFTQPPPAPTGFRYVTVDHFELGRDDIEGSPKRGLKRPHSPVKKALAAGDPNETFDLDSLRAAALKTKRKVEKENNSITVSSSDVVDVGTPPNEPIPSGKPVQEEDDLDALRMTLLKSMKRKRREPSSQLLANTAESVNADLNNKPSDTSHEGTQNSPDTADVDAGEENLADKSQPDPEEEEKLSSPELPPAAPVALKQPVVLESPQFRPLTAMSQSIVIRLSLDDLTEDQAKARADSYDDAAARLEKVIDDMGSKALTSTTTAASDTQVATNKSQETAPTIQPSADAKTNGDRPQATTTDEAGSTEATSTAATPPQGRAEKSVGDEQVVEKTGVVLAPEIVADPVRLEAERKASLARIREADAHIARLDAEIAALRLAISQKEAETSTTRTSGTTACEA